MLVKLSVCFVVVCASEMRLVCRVGKWACVCVRVTLCCVCVVLLCVCCVVVCGCVCACVCGCVRGCVCGNRE